MMDLEWAINKIYDLTPEQMMNMAVNLKQNQKWCEKHSPNRLIIKEAFERVLDMRYTERLDVYRYYYGNK